MTKPLRFNKSHSLFRFLLLFLISTIIGLFWFLLLYGHYPLHFTNVYWIYGSGGGDIFQHQIGWEWFRQEPWHFPIGRIDSYGYPFGTSIIYTDSIPLFAIPFKLLSPLFKQHLQYLGVWELASVIGQMLTGMLILGEFTPSYIKRILGASLLVLSPPLIFRSFWHDSLTAQWILLAAIWFILLEYRHKIWRGAWMVLFAAAVLVHLYFVVMLVPLWMIGLYFRYSGGKNKWMLIVDVFTVLGVVLLVGYCIGIFSLPSRSLAMEGFGLYSWNLNGFINPFSSPAILNELQTGTSGQYEGFSYLGLGNLLIFPVALILFLQKDYSRRQLVFLLPFMIVAILLGLFSLSNKAFVNNQLLWNIQLPESIFKLFSYFRVSGRFIWPVFYFLVLFGIISIIRNIRYSAPILILALLLQFIDVQQLNFTIKKQSGYINYQSNLQSEFWQSAAKVNRHIVLFPVNDLPSLIQVYTPFALLALQNQLTLNAGYFARADYGAIEKYADQVWEGLKVDQTDKQTIYVFWDSNWEQLAKEFLSDHMVICQVDGFTVGLSTENEMIQSPSEIIPYCSFPQHFTVEHMGGGMQINPF